MPPPSSLHYNKDEKVLCFHGELLYEAKILDSRLSDPSDKKSPMQYNVHYKGWKHTWDDWVSGERVRKFTEENKELAKTLKRDLDSARKPPPTKTTMTKKRGGVGSDLSSARGSEERQTSIPLVGRNKRGREELEKDETYFARPEVRIPCPDHLKAILVDDWEHVTKNLELLVLPIKPSANQIIDEYYEEEKVKRGDGTTEADVLEEVVAGLKDYFSKALGRILLYRFEREQYDKIRGLWENAVNNEWEGKGPGDCYGAEHLARLIVKMPELIAQTNMDQQAIHRLREEMSKLNLWIARAASRLFTAQYEHAGDDYIRRARGGN